MTRTLIAARSARGVAAARRLGIEPHPAQQRGEPRIRPQRREGRRGGEVDQPGIADLERAVEPAKRVVAPLETGVHHGDVERRDVLATRRLGQPRGDRLRFAAASGARQAPRQVGALVLAARELRPRDAATPGPPPARPSSISRYPSSRCARLDCGKRSTTRRRSRSASAARPAAATTPARLA